MRCISSVLCRTIAALPLVLSSGCAHFLDRPAQTVKFDARGADGAAVEGAVCTVSGVQGVWTVVTPGELRLPLTQADLNVSCTKRGQPNGYARVVPVDADISYMGVTKPGGVWQHVDPVLYPPTKFPSAVSVVMGDTVVATARPGR